MQAQGLPTVRIVASNNMGKNGFGLQLALARIGPVEWVGRGMSLTLCSQPVVSHAVAEAASESNGSRGLIGYWINRSTRGKAR